MTADKPKRIIDVLAPLIEQEKAKRASGNYVAFYSLKQGGELADSVKVAKLEKVEAE